MAALQSESAKKPDGPIVRCLLIPITVGQVVAASTAVAEVTVSGPLSPVPGGPDWLLGLMEWRGRRVPLVALEGLWGSPLPTARGRVVVFNTLNGNPRMPFIAIPIQGVPRLFQADSRSVVSSGESLGGVAIGVDLGGEAGLIPDLDAIEERLLELPLG